jgi:hypothetical protein
VNNLVSGQFGKGGALQGVGDTFSKEGINRSERGGKDESVSQHLHSNLEDTKDTNIPQQGSYGGAVGNAAGSVGSSVTGGLSSAGGYLGSFVGGGNKEGEKK